MSSVSSHFAPGLCAAQQRVKRDYRSLINLSSNEFIFPELSVLVEDWKKTIDPATIAQYPYYPRTEVAVARSFGLGDENVVLCAGADEAIRMLVTAVGASRRLILSWPSYDSYETYAQIRGLSVLRVPLQKGETLAHHRLELERELSGAQPSLVVMTSPHAITGETVAATDYQAVVQRCTDDGHMLIVDECYAGFELGGASQPGEVLQNVVLIRSFSKRFGMAGMRVAALVGSAETIRILRGWQSANPISGLSLSFLEYALENSRLLGTAKQRLAATRDWFCQRLRRADLKYWDSVANFVLVDLSCCDRARRAADALAKHRIIVRSFPARHPFDSCLRITMGDRSTMSRVVDELTAA